MVVAGRRSILYVSPVMGVPVRYLLLCLALVACNSENDFISPPGPPPNSQPPETENPIQEDRIVQAVEPKVDVLFIVDNSSSMGDEQQALQANFPEFMTYFVGSGLDYHIGMIATDVQQNQYSGKLRQAMGVRNIDTDTENPHAVFQGMTNTLGVISGSNESGRAAAYMALEIERDNFNAGFYRPEAELHLIFVSDTFDNSNSPSHPEFMQWAANLKSRPSLVTMHAIVQLLNDPSCAGFARPGVDYMDYAQTTGGMMFSICEEDWAPGIEELSLQTSGLKQGFFLTRVPVFDPDLLLEIFVRYTNESNQEITLGFDICMAGDEIENEDCRVVYNTGRNSVTFLDFTPPPKSEVLATYYISENFAADGFIEEDL